MPISKTRKAPNNFCILAQKQNIFFAIKIFFPFFFLEGAGRPSSSVKKLSPETGRIDTCSVSLLPLVHLNHIQLLSFLVMEASKPFLKGNLPT